MNFYIRLARRLTRHCNLHAPPSPRGYTYRRGSISRLPPDNFCAQERKLGCVWPGSWLVQALAKRQNRGELGACEPSCRWTRVGAERSEFRRKPSGHRCEDKRVPGAGSVKAEDSAEKRPSGVACLSGAAEKSWYPRSGPARADSLPGRQDTRPALSAGHLGKLLHLPSLIVPPTEKWEP